MLECYERARAAEFIVVKASVMLHALIIVASMNDHRFFDGVPVFFLSLNRTAMGRARSRAMQASFEAAGRHVELVPAVDGNASANEFTRTGKQLTSLLKRNTMSEMGCTLSHVLAIRRAEDYCTATGCEMAVVMEDDVSAELLPHWTVSITELAASLPENWAVVQLQLVAQKREWMGLMSAWRVDRSRLTIPHDRRSHFGTGAYLMHVRGMRQVRGGSCICTPPWRHNHRPCARQQLLAALSTATSNEIATRSLSPNPDY